MTDGVSGGLRREEPPGQDSVVHLIVGVGARQEQVAVESWLAERQLQPEIIWMSEDAISFRLNTSDVDAVRELIDQRDDISALVVAPGQPDYLLYRIYVQGPDGRRFRIQAAPAAQPISVIADEITARYERVQSSATVVDLVSATGHGQRLNPDSTLHDAGVVDGNELRVGFQALAG